jgi:hypothetical protein
MGGMRKLRRRTGRERYDVERLRPCRELNDMPTRKMSGVLLEFAEPVTCAVQDDVHNERLLMLAALCWNASFLPAEEQRTILRGMVDQFRQEDTLARTVLQDTMLMLIERKEQLYPDDRRLIMKHWSIGDGENRWLQVLSTLITS